MKKEALLLAIKQLITKYADDSIRHSIYECPLCNLFIDINVNNTEGNEVSNKDCIRCPNMAFDSLEYHARPCIQRGMKFKPLNYWGSGNNKNLSKFWEAVYILLSEQSEEDIALMPGILKLQIHRIAEYYNKYE